MDFKCLISLALSQILPDDEPLAKLQYQKPVPAIMVLNQNQSGLTWPRQFKPHIDFKPLDQFHRSSRPILAFLSPKNWLDHTTSHQQSFKPTGYQPFLTRGHIIAKQLSNHFDDAGQLDLAFNNGSLNNPYNLFTQTNYCNAQLQVKYEMAIVDQLKADQNIIYCAQPIFKGDELVARGIHLQARNRTNEFHFNVYLFNIEPGYQINYRTGQIKKTL